MPASPRNNREAGEYDLPPVRHRQRASWPIGASGTSGGGGPVISAQTTAEDVDTCLGVSRNTSMNSSGRRRLTPGIVAP